MFRETLLLGLATATLAASPSRARAEPAAWRAVEVAPAKTSIYVGMVTMTMPTFARAGETYAATYTAKVFPYFFYNETGRLTVNVTDVQLADLAAGKTIAFSGEAVRTDGAHRKVTARAVPSDATYGKLDVHVYVSKRIELIFHTTYRFHE